MKISIVRPCAMTTAEDGSSTKRLRTGDILELSTEWEINVAKGMIRNGLAMQIGGNAEPDQFKLTPLARKPRAKKAKTAIDITDAPTS